MRIQKSKTVDAIFDRQIYRALNRVISGVYDKGQREIPLSLFRRKYDKERYNWQNDRQAWWRDIGREALNVIFESLTEVLKAEDDIAIPILQHSLLPGESQEKTET